MIENYITAKYLSMLNETGAPQDLMVLECLIRAIVKETLTKKELHDEQTRQKSSRQPNNTSNDQPQR